MRFGSYELRLFLRNHLCRIVAAISPLYCFCFTLLFVCSLLKHYRISRSMKSEFTSLIAAPSAPYSSNSDDSRSIRFLAECVISSFFYFIDYSVKIFRFLRLRISFTMFRSVSIFSCALLYSFFNF